MSDCQRCEEWLGVGDETDLMCNDCAIITELRELLGDAIHQMAVVQMNSPYSFDDIIAKLNAAIQEDGERYVKPRV